MKQNKIKMDSLSHFSYNIGGSYFRLINLKYTISIKNRIKMSSMIDFGFYKNANELTTTNLHFESLHPH